MDPIVDDYEFLQNNQLLDENLVSNFVDSAQMSNAEVKTTAPITPPNSKVRLMLLLHKKHEQIFEKHFSLKCLPDFTGFKFRLSALGSLGDLLADQWWDGDERPTKKDAEYSALDKFLADCGALTIFAGWKNVESIRLKDVESIGAGALFGSHSCNFCSD
jgi:hypothetical protein